MQLGVVGSIFMCTYSVAGPFPARHFRRQARKAHKRWQDACPSHRAALWRPLLIVSGHAASLPLLAIANFALASAKASKMPTYGLRSKIRFRPNGVDSPHV